MGYDRAGFDVIGVDLHPQPNYPFTFLQADALDVLRGHVMLPSGWWRPAAIHASPPCQRHSAMSNCRPGLADSYPDLIAPVRELLEATGLPWVIENVPRAPLRADLTLCGTMFGRDLYRHRLFESNIPLSQPVHPPHTKPASRAGHWRPGTVISVAGNCAPVALAREVMGISWTNRNELGEAIPPDYAQHVGSDLLAYLAERAVA